MVEASLSATLRSWAPAALGAAALGFIAVMLVTGSRPESKQLIKFEPRGVMQVAPESITKVVVQCNGRERTLLRSSERTWTLEDGRSLAASTAAAVSMAVQFMNTSGPTREMTRQELTDAEFKSFGLEAPRLSASLFQGNHLVLTLHFGARNPDGLLRYMTLDGRSSVFLMSRFVGDRWEQVAQQVQ